MSSSRQCIFHKASAEPADARPEHDRSDKIADDHSHSSTDVATHRAPYRGAINELANAGPCHVRTNHDDTANPAVR